MAKPAGRVQIVKNPAVGCPVEVGMSSASLDKDAHSVLYKEQETRSTVGHGQPAGEWGRRTSTQEPLPGHLQQVVSCSKEDRRSSSCDRPVHIEQTSRHSPLIDGDGPDSQGCSMSGQRDSVSRHQGCISPCSDEPICEKVSPILCQQEDVSIQLGVHSISGQWSKAQRQNHINILEMDGWSA